ncbi:MAG: DegT/DnrJ/EryC1/StrS family aminotransferase, partial [Planctomycetales bacterium]|nr:DegT/DnrJ/EryC1/StrS family aminotransferase [Planctomycetales bacterium]
HVAREHNIPFIEDACQAPLAVWRGQPVGTHGLGGCLSFQASKNLTAGEGGAVLTNDEDFANRCYDFQTPGGGRAKASNGRGSNYRMTEFQGSILLTQLARLEAQAKQRDENAKYLSELLAKIPGIKPAKLYDGCDRSAWHLYMFHYDPQAFGGRPRATFLKELREAGVSASPGYSPLNRSAHVLALANNPHYLKIYGRDFMAGWAERNACPVNDQLCQQAVWFTQTVLLGTRDDMERIAASIDQVRMKA